MAPLDLEGLLSGATERTIDGTPAPLCRLADLVTMKRRAGRTVDPEDLAKLKIAHGELPDTDPSN